MPSRTPRRADFDAMSLKVASTLAPRLAEHARRVSGDGRAAGGSSAPRLPPGEIVILGSICRARACSDAGADLSRGAALSPAASRWSARVSGDKAAAEALVAEVQPHLDGGFALASIAADGAASFYHRFSTSDAVALEATELEPGWLEREYALFRCAMRVPIGTDNSAGVDAALPPPRPRRSTPTISSSTPRREETKATKTTTRPPGRNEKPAAGAAAAKVRRVAKSPRVRAAAAAAATDRTRVAAPARDRVAAGACGRRHALSSATSFHPPPTPPRRTASFR